MLLRVEVKYYGLSILIEELLSRAPISIPISEIVSPSTPFSSTSNKFCWITNGFSKPRAVSSPISLSRI